MDAVVEVAEAVWEAVSELTSDVGEWRRKDQAGALFAHAVTPFAVARNRIHVSRSATVFGLLACA
jgi:hypothetical protein